MQESFTWNAFCQGFLKTTCLLLDCLGRGLHFYPHVVHVESRSCPQINFAESPYAPMPGGHVKNPGFTYSLWLMAWIHNTTTQVASINGNNICFVHSTPPNVPGVKNIDNR